MVLSGKRLVVHIGTGKTGTTSIQGALRAVTGPLEAAGVRDLGIFLSASPVFRSAPFRDSAAFEAFLRTPHASDDIADAILDAFREAGDAVHTLVWVNEVLSMPGFFPPVSAALKRVAGAGVTLEVIVYLRALDAYAFSLYKQIGLKGKSAAGRIRSFADWAGTAIRPMAPGLTRWRDAFPDVFRPFNYDGVPDVVTHFAQVARLPQLEARQANRSPSNAMLYAMATFNDRLAERTRPALFRAAFGSPNILSRERYTPPLRALFPSDADLQAFRERMAPDQQALSDLLQQAGEPPLAYSGRPVGNSEVDPEELNQILLRMIFDLSDRVAELEREAAARGKP